jgi:hypothetical protein
MEFLPLYGGRERCRCRLGLDCYSIPDKRRPFLIPMRFVAACPRGHIEDFPFMEWVHRDTPWDSSHRLRMLAGRSSASLSGIKIECNCGKAETMTGSFNFDSDNGGALHRIGHDCSGHMPWLGRIDGRAGNCGEYLRVLQRGASNVYFPVTHSSIYIPLWGEGTSRTINKLLEMPRVWESLIAGLDEGKFVQRIRCEAVAMNYHVDPEELRSAAQRKLDGEEADEAIPRTEEEFRRQEYEALRDARGGETTALQVEIREAAEYGQDISQLFERICLVRKLRETRVLSGFSRLLPTDDPANVDLLPVTESDAISWLPATVVYGEGLFLQFNAERLQEWMENSPVVGERIAELSQHYNRRRLERGLQERVISPKYVLLHTFAHLLITQLAFDCGYGSASLRERIYCDVDDPDQPMQGILIYTASGDSEGTLGGLVRQGEPDRLPAIIFRALSRAAWCSSDPVCIESTGQGSDNANMAACHGCVLVPETSCEQGNRLLDRGVVIGTPAQPDAGYFSSMDLMPV